MRQLLATAARYGLSVHAAHLSGNKIGCYVPELQRIYFDLSLPTPERRTVIAHELGHHHYGHVCDSGANERQADAYAARMLVEPEWYAELEQINHDANWIAECGGAVQLHVVPGRRQPTLTDGDLFRAAVTRPLPFEVEEIRGTHPSDSRGVPRH